MMRAIEALVGLAASHDIAGLVVDDLHYADAASLEALSALVAPGGLRIFVAYRGDEIGPEARALAEAILAPHTRREVALQPLSEAQVAQLIDSLEVPGLDGARLAPRVARHTGGNPLFVLETLKALLLEEGSRSAGTLPVAANVRDLIARRLEKLSARALALARCAAVAGQDFSAELASHVMGVRPLDLADAWAELERAHVLRDGAFDHDLIHEAARASVPAAIARRLHAEIAAFLEAASTEPARVAQHWVAARRPREASQALLAAARRARQAGRRHEEGEILAQAADWLAQAGDAQGQFEALLVRAEAMMCDDLGDATREAVVAAGAAARDDGDRLRALLCEAQYLGNRSESEAAVRVGLRGGDLASSAGRADLAIHFAAIVAGGLCELRRVDEALACLVPHRAEAESLPPTIAAEYLIQLGIVLDLANRLREALEVFEAARRLAAANGLKDLLATAMSNLATTTSKRGEITRAIEYGRQALRMWREGEALKGTPMQTQVLLAHRLRDAGRYDEAIAMLEEALAEFRRAGARAWTFSAAHRLALAYSFVGQHARALNLLGEDPHDLPAKARAIWEAHRGEAARLAGTAARGRVHNAIALLGDDVDDGNNRLASLFAAAIAPPAEGEAMAAAVAAWAMAHERFGMAMAAHARAAACALQQKAADRGVAHIEGALRLEDQHQPDNFYRPEVWWIAAQAFAAAGRVAESDRYLERARAWIAETAASHVREEFRESFLHRNAVNREVIAASRRRLPWR
jgi:tetratricopeptide (TPR) repeat protein